MLYKVSPERTMCTMGVGVAVGVGVSVLVGVAVGLGVAVPVGLGVGVTADGDTAGVVIVGVRVAVSVGSSDIESGAGVGVGRPVQYALPATTSAVVTNSPATTPIHVTGNRRRAWGGRGDGVASCTSAPQTVHCFAVRARNAPHEVQARCAPVPVEGWGSTAACRDTSSTSDPTFCSGAASVSTWTACSTAARLRSVPHIGQMSTSSPTRAPQDGQRRANRRRLAWAFPCVPKRESRAARPLSACVTCDNGWTGCSQRAQTLAVREMDAPQWGHALFPRSRGGRTFADVDLRLGAGSSLPHIKQVRAEALTSAPH
jgi:hypothetical protein